MQNTVSDASSQKYLIQTKNNLLQANAKVLALVAFILSLFAAIGLQERSFWLANTGPFLLGIRLNSTICLVVLSFFIFFISKLENVRGSNQKFFAGLLLVPMILTGLNLLEYIFWLDLGVDSLFGWSPRPGNMSATGSWIMFSISVLLFLKVFTRVKIEWAFQTFFMIQVGLSTANLMNSIVGHGSFVYAGWLNVISSYQAFCVLLLSIACLYSYPDEGFMKFYSSKFMGSSFLRGALPSMLVSVSLAS